MEVLNVNNIISEKKSDSRDELNSRLSISEESVSEESRLSISEERSVMWTGDISM